MNKKYIKTIRIITIFLVMLSLIISSIVSHDETSNFQDYYYQKVINLEIMKEKGQTTVSN